MAENDFIGRFGVRFDAQVRLKGKGMLFAGEGSQDASWAELLRRARAGDTRALGGLLEQLRPYLLVMANDKLDDGLQSKGGASDLVQETFLEAHRDFPQFTGESEEEAMAWLARILQHNAADFARRFRKADKRRIDREVRLSDHSSLANALELFAHRDPSPSANAMTAEQTEQLDRCIAALPEQYQRVIALRHQEDLPFDEIGVQMNISGEAARKLWSRAIGKLQRLLEPRDE